MKKSKVRIVMAEDDEDDRLLAREAFEESHLANPVDFVGDGVELMEYLRCQGAYADREPGNPGLILLDLNMPRKNGFEVMEEIRKDENLSIIPIVVLTTSREDRDIVLSYRKGVNSFISKPVTLEGLVQVVRQLNQYWFEIVMLPENNTERSL